MVFNTHGINAGPSNPLYDIGCHVITNESVNFAVETVTCVLPEGTLLAKNAGLPLYARSLPEV